MVDPVSFHPVCRTGPAIDPAARQQCAAAPGSREQPDVAPSLPRLVSLAQQLSEAGPPIDYAKIAQIRQAIAHGGFTIDPDAIARAMIAFGGKDGA